MAIIQCKYCGKNVSDKARIIEAAQTDWAYELVSIDNNSIVFPYGFGEETTTTFLRTEDDGLKQRSVKISGQNA